MQIKTIVTLVMLIITQYCFGQAPTRGEIRQLHAELRDRLLASANASRAEVRTEVILMVFETDSSGKICKVNCLADAVERDSAFVALSRVVADDLKGWQSDRCRNRILIVPVISLGNEGAAGYTYPVFSEMFWANQRNGHLLRVYGKTIVTNIINYSQPFSIIDDHAPGKFIPLKD